MRKILVATSGTRADETPLIPVVSALHLAGNEVIERAWTSDELSPDDFGTFDLVLVLGDRYEIGYATMAATVARIPIAHIHGGEASFGSFDNQIRDAVTKLAHIHFVAAEPMRERLLALGEESNRIHVVGAPGLDNLPLYLKKKRKRQNPGWIMITYHPPTLGNPETGINALLGALGKLNAPWLSLRWSSPNHDPGSEIVKCAIVKRFGSDLVLNYEQTPDEYLADLRQAAVVIGNSSSGIIEAPTLECPTVNIGPRQDGRLKGPSVFDCPENEDAIVETIWKALDYEGPFTNPYGKPGASRKIAEILSTAEIDMVKRWSS